MAGNDELVYGYIAEYLDGELPANLHAPYKEALQDRQKLVEDFQVALGRFQVAMGAISAPEPLKHKLRTLVQDDQIRETIEATEIQDIERSEFWSNLVRRVALALIAVGLIGGLVYAFMPVQKDKLNVIEAVGYEAVALEEDPDGRINLPTNDLQEVSQFIKQVPGLTFKPQALRPLTGWVPEGVSVIDYEVIKVVAVMYKSPERNGEHLHYFMLPGAMKDLPYQGDEADYRGIRYRVYASDKMNMLVWQFAPDMIAVLAGHRSAPELAEIARSGTPE